MSKSLDVSDELSPGAPNQAHLAALPNYQQTPFTEFAMVGPDTDLASLNLSWREADLPQGQRTKHVHRLHPYLGKFVPQLVEVFLRKFRPRAVYDPFVGSGTTLVEANALGIIAYGCDVSAFNCLLTRVKTASYDLALLQKEVDDILRRFGDRQSSSIETCSSDYLSDWYHPEALEALLAYRHAIPRYEHQEVLKVILCRAARSARLARHFDLDFPSQPQRDPYYCHKHRRTCLPTRNAAGFLRRYSRDTVSRIAAFAGASSPAVVNVIHGDSRQADVPPVDLILTSPPYVGLIDYHEQHRYAYELLDLPRHDCMEIGPALHGSSTAARATYRAGMLSVFAQALRSLESQGRIVVVIGDKYGLYDGLAAELGLIEEHRLRRHVNRRTGRRPGEFFENILIWRRP